MDAPVRGAGARNSPVIRCTLAAIQTEITNGTDPMVVTAVARGAAPVVAGHIDMLQSAAKTPGIPGPTGGATTPTTPSPTPTR